MLFVKLVKVEYTLAKFGSGKTFFFVQDRQQTLPIKKAEYEPTNVAAKHSPPKREATDIPPPPPPVRTIPYNSPLLALPDN
jgi:hypothetical protein